MVSVVDHLCGGEGSAVVHHAGVTSGGERKIRIRPSV